MIDQRLNPNCMDCLCFIRDEGKPAGCRSGRAWTMNDRLLAEAGYKRFRPASCPKRPDDPVAEDPVAEDHDV